ncbi:Peptide-N4-(N-acetyl-beta-glucosaminyl)asparagine amidase A [Capsicum baccatum]|uniref:Peptide-N4-(N-acetyl-beta-glucosaminyl)asparagine amidase A n=1 Tax=Capsicum baccatum TaxID=33114 RepID=A0A2G2XB66_CAPBA|nr:Peptide-N4-(N-acetyl-beta-glucosaminyl)asparagine amidase A [Capsicum baccatum]
MQEKDFKCDDQALKPSKMSPTSHEHEGYRYLDLFTGLVGLRGEKIGVDFDSGADLIVPISRNVDLNDGLWYEIENSTDVKSKDFKIPQNMYLVVLEVYVSFHENDDSWYGNPVNEYVSLNNLSIPGNGALTEVVVSLDEMVVGGV